MTKNTRATLNRYCVEFARSADADYCESQCVFAHSEAEASDVLVAEFDARGLTVFVCDVYEG